MDLIKIASLPEREGQILRNHLLDQFNPSGEPHGDDLLLDLDLKIEKEATSLRRDGTSQRFNIRVNLAFKLLDQSKAKALQKPRLLYEDQILRTTSFSIGRSALEPGYPGFVAEKDAIARALKLASKDVYLMVATYFKKFHPSQKMPQNK